MSVFFLLFRSISYLPCFLFFPLLLYILFILSFFYEHSTQIATSSAKSEPVTWKLLIEALGEGGFTAAHFSECIVIVTAEREVSGSLPGPLRIAGLKQARNCRKQTIRNRLDTGLKQVRNKHETDSNKIASKQARNMLEMSLNQTRTEFPRSRLEMGLKQVRIGAK